jgi:ParB family transcriptional regulator, chromosome partitioning protein
MARKPLVDKLPVWHELGAATEPSDVQSLKEAKIIAIARIMPNPDQPRKSRDDESLQELADSIRDHGLLQPILVRPVENHFLIIAGHRRYEACKLLGMEAMPCLIRDAEDEEILEQSIIENVQREDIAPVEEAQCYRLLMEKHGYSMRDMASKVHKSVGYIHGRLELLKHEDIAQRVAEAKIGIFEARELAKVQDPAARQELTRRVEEGELDRQGLKEEVNQLTRKPQQLPLFSPGAFSKRWQRLHQDLETLEPQQLSDEEQQRTRELLEEMREVIEHVLSRIA